MMTWFLGCWGSSLGASSVLCVGEWDVGFRAKGERAVESGKKWHKLSEADVRLRSGRHARAAWGWNGWAARELDCSQMGEGLAVVRDGVVVEIELKQGYADWKD